MKNTTKAASGILIVAIAAVVAFMNHPTKIPAPPVQPIAHTNVMRPTMSPTASTGLDTPTSTVNQVDSTATNTMPQSPAPVQPTGNPSYQPLFAPGTFTNTAPTSVPNSNGANTAPVAPDATASDPGTPTMPATQPAPGTLTEIVPGGWYASNDPGSLQQPVLMPASSWPGDASTASTKAHTMILVLNPETTSPAINAAYNTPAQLQAAYELPASAGGSGVIAIVDAYHNANALSDFNTFSKYFALPVETSTTATAATNKVFQVVYATGTAPVNDTTAADDCLGWIMEMSLDVQYAHALAPNAKIVLVECKSAAWVDLIKGIQAANALPGVKEVSMSFGSQEFSSETSYDSYFTQAGVAYFAGGGDTTTSCSYPAHSPNVIGCGGTTLTRNSTGVLQSETTWNMTGFGLSPFEVRPSYQSAISGQVGTKRGGNDVSFLANPNTGVYIFDSTAYDGMSGWSIIGGTSLSTPCLAAIANDAGTCNGFPASSQAELVRLYANLGNNVTFRDITSGAAGSGVAGYGWDLPTGVGSPHGLVGK
jgi:kumamolisin